MMRRSTSLAVCCAPTRIMPRLRPRSATSSRISLIGDEPSRGAYLLSSSSTTNVSGRGGAALLLGLELPLQRDADDEALSPVVEVVQVDDSDLGVGGGDGVHGPPGHVGAHERRQPGPRGQEAADEGVDRAYPDGATGPLEGGLVVAHPVDDEVDQVLVGAQDVAVDRPGAVIAHRLAVAGELGGDVVHDHRVLLALVLGVGEDERQQLGRRRTPPASSRRRARRSCRLVTSGPAFGSWRRGGA